MRIINPEELLQITINSGDDPVPGDDADAKYHNFEDEDNYGVSSSDIWED